MTNEAEEFAAAIAIQNNVILPHALSSYRNARTVGKPKAPVQADGTQELFVTLDQERWWALAFLGGPTPSWHYISMELSFAESVKVDLYKTAARSLFNRFPVLKSKFSLVGDLLTLTYIDDVQVEEIINASLSGMNDFLISLTVQELNQENEKSKFPFSLFQFSYKKTDDSIVIVWKIHHIITDIKSSNILREIFYGYYYNIESGIALARNSIDFQSYARWQRQFYCEKTILLLQNFWTEWSDHFKGIVLPGSQNILTSCSGHVLRYRAFLSATNVTLLEDAARKLRVSFYNMILCALLNACSIWAKADQVGALIIGDMRTYACLRYTVGLFACFDPIVITVEKSKGIIDVLHKVQDARMTALEMRLPPLRDAWPGSQFSWGSKLPMLVNDFTVDILSPGTNTIFAAPAGSFSRNEKHAPLSIRIIRDRTQAALELEFNENVFSRKECYEFCANISNTLIELASSCGIYLSQS